MMVHMRSSLTREGSGSTIEPWLVVGALRRKFGILS